VLADLVCNLVKAPIGWVLSLMVRELAASMGRKKRLLRLRWSRLALLLEMAMAFRSACLAMPRCGPPKKWGPGQRNGVRFSNKIARLGQVEQTHLVTIRVMRTTGFRPRGGDASGYKVSIRADRSRIFAMASRSGGRSIARAGMVVAASDRRGRAAWRDGSTTVLST
jgi:hypothetical protein